MSSGSSKRPRKVREKVFKRGDRVTWNSEAGWVTGVVQKKITSPIVFKGYTRHASKEVPQYIIKSERTDHVAIHKGSALTKIPKKETARRRPTGNLSRKPRHRE